MIKKWSKITTAFVIGFSAAVFLLGGINSLLNAETDDRYEELQKFAKVLNLVQRYYVEEIDTKKLIYGGIRGMLETLDPHTNFLPPDIFKDFQSETSGEFGGIGIEISVQNGILTVISPIEDTPAWTAGLKPGDRLIEIDGVNTKGMSLVEAAQKMRGKKGAEVKLGILRKGADVPIHVKIKRGVVKLKAVKTTDLDDGYIFIRLTSFIETTAKDLRDNLDKFLKKPAKIKGLILDLRRNPGGLLDQAISVSDMFLEKGIIVSTIGRNEKEKDVVYAKKADTLNDFPIVVLINEASASASEIVAGALRDNKRALIMGQRSFGKGSVQSVVKLGDGSGLKLTVARYYTPNGSSIQAEGITPDIILDDVDAKLIQEAVVKRDGIRREQDIEGHLLSESEKKKLQQSQKNQLVNDTLFFWNKVAEKPSGEMTEKEKLLTSDFQVLQAYNYLKAWKIMEKIN